MKKHIILSVLAGIVGLSAFLTPQAVEARIDTHGFYFVEDDVYNIYYMSELAGSNNVVKMAYNNLLGDPQVLANKIRANGYIGMELTIYLEEGQFLNTNGARDVFLQSVRKKLYQDSDLGLLLTGIHILEEPYTLIRHGYFDHWAIFQGKNTGERDVIMKAGLESYISSIKSVFPGVPTIIVENYWGANYIPPANLDVLGVDAYYVPTSSACDATQKAKFDAEVTNLINLAKQYGKPIQMVGGVFDASNYYKMPTQCQAQWYIDLAKNTPEVTSFNWFLYATVDGVGGARNHPSGIVEYLKAEGRKIVTEYKTGTQPTTPPAPYVPTCQGDCAQFVSQNVPSSVIAGQNFTASITLRNVGTEIWGAGTHFLGSQNSQDNTTWVSSARVTLPKSVIPGEQVTVTVSAKAPATTGARNFQWRMLREYVRWFGDTTPNVSINVVSAPVVIADNAQFVSQTVPTSVTPGQDFTATITMKNNGTSVWGTAYYYGLGAVNPMGNTTWGTKRSRNTSNVNPDGTFTFTFNVTAPASVGTYNFQWRMLHDGHNYLYTPYIPANWFGDFTPNVSVNVVAEAPVPYVPTCQGDCAQFISQSIPTSVARGANFTASVTLRNTGSITWGASTHFLGSQNPQDNTTWLSSARVKLPKDVAPGEYVTLNFSAIAPSLAGNYKFQWRMVHEFVRWFGGYTTDSSIIVQ